MCEGPNSPLIAGKLAEMGTILERIHTRLTLKQNARTAKQSSLLHPSGGNIPGADDDDLLPAAIVVMGDHGMADGGGHGGSSGPEVLVPFVLMTTDVQVSAYLPSVSLSLLIEVLIFNQM